MSQEVSVHVNRGSADSLESSVEAVETRGSFDLRLESHGSPAHVHCRLDGALERVASLETANYYVEEEGETVVPVRIAAEAIDDSIDGRLEVLTGYGSESLTIPVTVDPAPAAVDVDDSLAEPGGGSDQSPAGVDRLLAAAGLEPATLAILALGVLAVVIGAVTAAAIGGPVATAGIAIVVLGVAVAIALLVR